MRSIKILLICLVFPVIAMAQRPSQDEIESLRVAIFTKHMDLTPQESKEFWPVYNEYLREKNKLNKQRNVRMGKLKSGIASLTDPQVESLTDQEVSYHESETALTRKYHERFKKILPIRKVAKLYGAEEAFKRELLDRIREGRGGRGRD